MKKYCNIKGESKPATSPMAGNTGPVQDSQANKMERTLITLTSEKEEIMSANKRKNNALSY